MERNHFMADYRNQNSMRCSCMRDPLRGLALAIAYVPWQYWDQTYDLEKALQCGTMQKYKPSYRQYHSCQ